MIDLIKAELQQSKRGLFSFITALALFLVGMLFFAGALVLILISIGLALERVLPTVIAVLITGVITALLGLTLILIGGVKSKQR